MAAACQEAAAAAAASSAAARVRGGAGPSSSSGGGGSDGGSAPWDAQSLVNASLWLEGASCEARQLALLCACQQQAAPGASASSRHLLNSLVRACFWWRGVGACLYAALHWAMPLLQQPTK